MYSYHDLIADLRRGPYTSIGCYPLFFITTDGEALSFAAVRENLGQCARSTRDKSRDGWGIAGIDVNWEDPELYCADSGERIESAYAEPEEVANGS
jgi:hypothetical protein